VDKKSGTHYVDFQCPARRRTLKISAAFSVQDEPSHASITQVANLLSRPIMLHHIAFQLSREIKQNAYDQSIQDENSEAEDHFSAEEELDDDYYGEVGIYDAGDESEDQDQIVEREDGEESEENEPSEESESDDGHEYQGAESEEDDLESVRRKKSRASNLHSSKTLPSTEGKTLAGNTIRDPIYFLFSHVSGSANTFLGHCSENVSRLLNDSCAPETFLKKK
jgi:hypothetical protein